MRSSCRGWPAPHAMRRTQFLPLPACPPSSATTIAPPARSLVVPRAVADSGHVPACVMEWKEGRHGGSCLRQGAGASPALVARSSAPFTQQLPMTHRHQVSQLKACQCRPCTPSRRFPRSPHTHTRVRRGPPAAAQFPTTLQSVTGPGMQAGRPRAPLASGLVLVQVPISAGSCGRTASRARGREDSGRAGKQRWRPDRRAGVRVGRAPTGTASCRRPSCMLQCHCRLPWDYRRPAQWRPAQFEVQAQCRTRVRDSARTRKGGRPDPPPSHAFKLPAAPYQHHDLHPCFLPSLMFHCGQTAAAAADARPRRRDGRWQATRDEGGTR